MLFLQGLLSTGIVSFQVHMTLYSSLKSALHWLATVSGKKCLLILNPSLGCISW